MRKCRSCQREKSAGEFYGRATLCKECAKDYQHEYYHKLIRRAA